VGAKPRKMVQKSGEKVVKWGTLRLKGGDAIASVVERRAKRRKELCPGRIESGGKHPKERHRNTSLYWPGGGNLRAGAAADALPGKEKNNRGGNCVPE